MAKYQTQIRYKQIVRFVPKVYVDLKKSIEKCLAIQNYYIRGKDC